jgi:hypothetical protein
MREIELIKKYNYDQKKAHDLLKEEFVKDLLEEVKDLIKENKVLTRQLEYIRSGEYLNQLKFERNMLEDIVDNGEVSKEDKEFIDCTHRNTELLEQQQEFIDYLEDMLDDDNDIFSVIRVKDVLNKYLETIGGNKDE